MGNFRPQFELRKFTLFALCSLTVVGAYVYGVYNVLPQVLIAVATTSCLDVLLWFARTRKWLCPTGALISGLIIALLLTPDQVWYIPLVMASLAIGSKHVIRRKGRNLFNPAALAVAAIIFMFPEQLRFHHPKYLEGGPSMHFAQSYLGLNDWHFLFLGGHGWMASTSAVAVVVLGTVLICRLRRIELVATFLFTYALLFTAFAFFTGQDIIARILLEIFPSGVLFFSFFMLTEPPTSPRTPWGRAVYGGFTAMLAFLFRFVASPVQFLLFALVTANLFNNVIAWWSKGISS